MFDSDDLSLQRKISTVIFDMDGVLVDSEPATVMASTEALLEIGVHANPEDFHEFTGMGDDIFIGGTAAKYGAKYNSSIKERMYDIFVEKAAERVRVMPWSRDLIEALKEKGFYLAVASASDKKKVFCNIKCIGIKHSGSETDDKSDVFDAVVTGSDVAKKKPAPDIFLKAMEKVRASFPDVTASECLVCEDAISGVKAAKAAGMLCVAVTTSFSREQLTAAGADFIFDDLKMLEGLLNI